MALRTFLSFLLITFSFVSLAQDYSRSTYSSRVATEEDKQAITMSDNANQNLVQTVLPEDFQLLVELRKQLMTNVDVLEAEIALLSRDVESYEYLESEKLQIERYQQTELPRIQILLKIENRSEKEEQELQTLQGNVEADRINL